MLGFFKKLFRKKAKNYLLGKKAEVLACKYIKKHTPYKILVKNFRHKNYEVDILAYDKSSNCLIIVEVKSRSENALVSGYLSAIKPSKMRSVLACKSAYLKISPHRFDSFSYAIFEVVHDSEGKILQEFFHENIPLKRKSLKESTFF